MKNLSQLTLALLAVSFSSCGQPGNKPVPNNVSAQAPGAQKLRVKQPGSLETADFNNDKFPDVAVVSEVEMNVSIFLGDGKGNLSPAKGSPFSTGELPNDIAIGDYNNDGNPDLAFANHDQKFLTVLLGKGDGSFAPAPRSPFTVGSVPHAHGIATGDFNSDDRLDLVTDSWANDEVEVLFGDSSGGFKTPGTFFKVGDHPYQRIRTGDVNSDGKSDIITTNIEGRDVSVLLCDGKGGFAAAPGSPYPCGDAPFGVALGDLNADGKTDLAVVNSPGSTGGESTGVNGMTVMTGDGTGKFARLKGSPFNAGQIPNRVAIGDVNGDGVNDVVTSDNGSDKIYLFVMSKNGTVSSSTIVTGKNPKGIAITDLDADGKGDIVVGNNADDTVVVIMGK